MIDISPRLRRAVCVPQGPQCARASNEEDAPWRRPCYIHSAPRRILAAENAPPLCCLGWGATRIMLPSVKLIIVLRWHAQGDCLGSYDFHLFLNKV